MHFNARMDFQFAEMLTEGCCKTCIRIEERFSARCKVSVLGEISSFSSSTDSSTSRLALLLLNSIELMLCRMSADTALGGGSSYFSHQMGRPSTDGAQNPVVRANSPPFQYAGLNRHSAGSMLPVGHNLAFR